MVAHRYESPLGQIVEHLPVVDSQLYVEFLKQPAHKLRPRGVGMVGMKGVHLIEGEKLHKPLHQFAVSLQLGHHCHYVVGIEHSFFLRYVCFLRILHIPEVFSVVALQPPLLNRAGHDILHANLQNYPDFPHYEAKRAKNRGNRICGRFMRQWRLLRRQ